MKNIPTLKTSVCALLLLLVGCGDGNPVGAPVLEPYVIADTSFMGAHEDRRCSKGCRYVYVPDTWFLRFCNVDRPTDCFWRSIEHAPWAWQEQGKNLTVMWQQHERGWRVVGYLNDGKRVDL